MTAMLINGPLDASHHFIFAHGAGAGMEHDFMQVIAEGLAARGICVFRFEFPYMQKRRENGSKTPPNRQPQLMAAYQQVMDEIQNDHTIEKLIIGGKSMGGRIASLVASENDGNDLSGLICLGYPFYAPKKERLAALSRGTHLYETNCPTLIMQGDRDHFGKEAELKAMPLDHNVQLAFLADGDHSFKPRVKSGFTLEQHQQTIINTVARFILAL